MSLAYLSMQEAIYPLLGDKYTDIKKNEFNIYLVTEVGR